jgi:hypothetical protein
VEKDERYIQTVVRLGEVTIKTKSLIWSASKTLSCISS